MKNMDELNCFGGCMGSVFTEDKPALNTAIVRPYIIAVLLHRGAVTIDEVMHSLSPHCMPEDLIEGCWDEHYQDYIDCSKAESLVLEVLGEMIGQQVVRYNFEKSRWILIGENVPELIKWVSSLGGQIPAHTIQEISADDWKRVRRAHEAFDRTGKDEAKAFPSS